MPQRESHEDVEIVGEVAPVSTLEADAERPALSPTKRRWRAATAIGALSITTTAFLVAWMGARGDVDDVRTDLRAEREARAEAEDLRDQTDDELGETSAERDALKAQMDQVVGSDSSPLETDDPVSPEDEVSGAAVTNVDLGQTGLDDGVAFTLKSVREAKVLAVGEYSDPIRADAGGKLLVAKISVKNLGKLQADPFCGDNGTVAIDASDRNFEVDSDSISIEGNLICQGIQPGFSNEETIVFQVPNDAEIVSLAMWNGQAEGDGNGGLSFVRSSTS